MKNKNFLGLILFVLVFIKALTVEIFAQDPCPNYSDVLDNGWAAPLHEPHDPQRANRDEFGTVAFEPFLIKVNNYPPVESFPCIVESGPCEGTDYFYFSFDTDDDYSPINFKMPKNQPNIVKTYRIDENGNYLSGYEVTVVPPDRPDIGSGAPDFVMKYDGTMHDVAWDLDNHPWENVVTNVETYIPPYFSVSLDGVNSLNYDEQSEFIADINGGGGRYRIKWSVRDLAGGDWIPIKENDVPQTYYHIYGNVYYFYDDEYKLNFTMPDNDIVLKVEIFDVDYSPLWILATKVVYVNPEAVTFINHIETSENYGSLILNENHSDPISSGDTRSLAYQNDYSIRTNELPFLVDWNSTGKTEKHINWIFNNPTIPPVHLLNYDFTLQASTERTMKSTFLSTGQAVIKTFVDGVELSGLDLKFNDPWFYYKDGSDNWYQSDEFIPYPSPLELYNNSLTSYGGTFLNQRPEVEGIYYSVQSPLVQTVNLGGTIGTRTFYFQNWSTTGGASLQQAGSNPPGYDQKAVVFTSSGSTVNANLKGHLMSNDQNGISSASQRKMVRTDNGQYHVVYESMGTVWYTYSLTDNYYGAWSADETFHYNAKNPSIDYDGNVVKIVFEGYEYLVGGDAKIWLLTFNPSGNGYYSFDDSEAFTTYPNSYFGNAKPVIAYSQWEVFIAYRTGPTGGIKHKTKWSDNPNWWWGDEEELSGTNANCKNPSVIGLREPFHAFIFIVYENYESIHFKEAWRHTITFGNAYWDFGVYENFPVILSKRCGFNLNRYPVISLCDNLSYRYLMVSWQGIYDSTPTNPMPKTDGSEPLYRAAAVVKTGYGLNWSTPSSFSDNVDYTNNGSLNIAYGSILTWSESDGQNSKYVRRRTTTGYDAITALSTNGIHTLVSNGSEFGNMKAVVFDNSTQAPYLLHQCTNDFTYIPDGPAKITEDGTIDISYGRAGIIEKNDIEFVFNVGDVLLNGETIKFIERVDTIPVTNIEELNASVRTDTLNLNEQSELIFSDYYYVVNGEKADSILSDEFNVNFKCELVKMSTGVIVGAFEEVNYNKSNLEEYGQQGYLIDCSGIEAGEYYLRLSTSVNEEVGLSLSDIQMDNVLLEKSNLNVRNFKGSIIPLEYSLEQNYPNPFNPASTTRYQIPKDGMVTLKIYDILGAEVMSLVNEEQVAGKYDVNFDASRFASGVYIYRLNVNEYTNVKKMVLLK